MGCPFFDKFLSNKQTISQFIDYICNNFINKYEYETRHDCYSRLG